ncbi:MAG TPA: VWA domain-containing protein [Bryobacteraceae bacterium]|nr:VWA domain-containing protein [Bryobacteraceae bacterium]
MYRAVLLLFAMCFPYMAAPPTRPAQRIRVPVWVDGTPVESIGVKDFNARLAGKALKVLDVKGPADDLIVLAVVDLTGDLAYVTPAKSALETAVKKLGPRAWVGLLRAQDGLRVLVDPTADREALAQAIESVPVSGKAGLLDTVETAARIADGILAKSNVRVAVLYITDSDIENYREDYTNPVINSSDSRDLSRRFPEVLVHEKISKLEASLAGRQSPLFVVQLRYFGNRLNEAYRNGLERLARVTGGAGVFCRSDAEIPGAVDHVMGLISSYYSVTVALPERRADTLQLQLEHGGGRTLNYRARFVLKGR